eukprot:c13132_g1_i1.p1 GENE.c13132_g1_i1~~c13132_g1_i1.p1  ORF type:complete len:535 (-),score=91.24 c13132_g1_i1:165-1769(-)
MNIPMLTTRKIIIVPVLCVIVVLLAAKFPLQSRNSFQIYESQAHEVERSHTSDELQLNVPQITSLKPEPTEEPTSKPQPLPPSCVPTGPVSTKSIVTITTKPPYVHVFIQALDDKRERIQSGDDVFFVQFSSDNVLARPVVLDHRNGSYECEYPLVGNTSTFVIDVILGIRVRYRDCNASLNFWGYPRNPVWTKQDRDVVNTAVWRDHYEHVFLRLHDFPRHVIDVVSMNEDIWQNYDTVAMPFLFTNAFVRSSACVKFDRCRGSHDFSFVQHTAEADLNDFFVWVPRLSHAYWYSPQEVEKCLKGKTVLFIGDSVTHSMVYELEALFPQTHQVALNTTIRYVNKKPTRSLDLFVNALSSPSGEHWGDRDAIKQADHVYVNFGIWNALEVDYAFSPKFRVPRDHVVMSYRINITKFLSDYANPKTWTWALTIVPRIKTGNPSEINTNTQQTSPMRYDLLKAFNDDAIEVLREKEIPVLDLFLPTLAMVRDEWWADDLHWRGRRSIRESNISMPIFHGAQYIHLYLSTICPEPSM